MICDQAQGKRKEEELLWGLQQEDNRLLQVTNVHDQQSQQGSLV
jgi:hypothetical protein